MTPRGPLNAPEMGVEAAAAPASGPRTPWLGSVFVVFGLMLVGTSLAPLTHSLTLVAGALLVGLPVLTRLAQTPYRPRSRVVELLRPVGVVALLLAAWMPEPWRMAGPALALALWARSTELPGERARLMQLAAGAAAYTLVHPLTETFPALIQIQEGWAALISSVASGVTGRPVAMSASALGFDALLLASLVVVADATRLGTAARPRVVATNLAALWLLPLAWAVAAAFLPGCNVPPQIDSVPTADPLALGWRALASHSVLAGALIVAWVLALATSWAMGRPPSNPPDDAVRPGTARTFRGARTRPAAWLAAMGLLALCGGLAPWLEAPRWERDRTVLLYDRGYLNWLRPNFEYFGKQSAGMFGMLQPFLEAYGLRAIRVRGLAQDTLEQARLLFIANPESTISDVDRAIIWDFVRNGGHLLVLGDHTWFRGSGPSALNELLEPSHIRFHMDSANFFTGGWAAGYRFLVNPLTAGLDPESNDPGIVVGASLDIGPPARPLVLGRWGHSDAPALGDSAGGYLGNLAFDPGERVGDLVLAATEPFGRGRVTVFGDTSPFFNSLLTTTYPFVSRLFRWAASMPPEPPFRAFLLDCLLALGLGLWLASLSGSSASALVMGAMMGAVVGWLGEHRQQQWPPPVGGRIALVDVSHLPSYPVSDWIEGGLMGLQVNLMRFGYLTLQAADLRDSLLDRAQVLVLVAPRRRFTSAEADRIVRWVRRGGALIMAIGAERAAPSSALLQRFQFKLRPVPLGHVTAQGGEGGVPLAEAWPVVAAGTGLRRLLRWEDYDIAWERRVGAGRVVLIGDSQFFCNYNLEHEMHAHTSNVNFIGLLLGAKERVRQP